MMRATGDAVANFIKENIICKFGIPKVILFYSETPFVNRQVRQLLASYGINQKTSTPHYPQGNGQVEVTNKSIIRI